MKVENNEFHYTLLMSNAIFFGNFWLQFDYLNIINQNNLNAKKKCETNKNQWIINELDFSQ